MTLPLAPCDAKELYQMMQALTLEGCTLCTAKLHCNAMPVCEHMRATFMTCVQWAMVYCHSLVTVGATTQLVAWPKLRSWIVR